MITTEDLKSTHNLFPGVDAFSWRATDDFSRISFVSQQASSLTGYPLSQWTDELDFWAKYINPVHHQDWITQIKQLPSDQSQLKFEHQAISKTGMTLWLRTSIHVERDVQGKIQSLYGLSVDFTDIKRNEQKLQRSVRELESIKFALDQASVVAITDTNGIITYVNDKFCELSGYSREEIIGKTHRIFKSGDHPKEFYENLWKTIQSGRIWRGEIKNKTKAGAIYWSYMTVVPFLEEGLPYQFVAIRTDITAIKKAEEEHIRFLESEAARMRSEAAVQARDRFVSMAAHELRTPITSLQALLELLQRQGQVAVNAGSEVNQAMKMIDSAVFQTKRLAALINDMLDVTRITANRLKLHLERVNLTKLVTALVENYSEDFRLAQCKVSLSVVNQIYGNWDASRIEQIIINLFTNAMKFGRGSPIEVTLRQRDRFAEIEVSDHGIGIPDKFKEHLFERFERAEGAECYQGLGLGLWISDQIVKAHQGTIQVESELGQGSTFRVILPIQQ